VRPSAATANRGKGRADSHTSRIRVKGGQRLHIGRGASSQVNNGGVDLYQGHNAGEHFTRSESGRTTELEAKEPKPRGGDDSLDSLRIRGPDVKRRQTSQSRLCANNLRARAEATHR